MSAEGQLVAPASDAAPRLSIGLPVFNGQRYLAEAIQSVLDGTYADWELIISDNASTDETEVIARGFAERDSRVRYLRNATNIGPLANFNRVFRASRGEYFKWLAYDDLCGPDLLSRCIDVLDGDPSIILCSARFIEIDQDGHTIGEQPYRLDLTATEAHVRLGRLMCTSRGHPILFGVIRAGVLGRTRLLAPYHGSDRALLAELTLHGRLWEISEVLWSSRDHPERSPYVRMTRAGWSASRGIALPPHLASIAHLVRVLATAPVGRLERIRCTLALGSCVARRFGQLAPVLGRELLDAGRGFARRPFR
jgi:glycosyltransferase involved in cell wall biosynthesis